MNTQPKIKLTDLHLNDGSHGLPKNPRFIRDARFKKLCDSIRDFPEAMPARGIVVDEDGVILGGNMRYRACRRAVARRKAGKESTHRPKTPADITPAIKIAVDGVLQDDNSKVIKKIEKEQIRVDKDDPEQAVVEFWLDKIVQKE